jgi:digeranylgeranylglycerophospholipid reductase
LEENQLRVAIIGAGIAGLSCAHELERYGISPAIYEDLDFIGDREPHITVILEVTDRPVTDIVKYFSEEFDINLEKLNVIKKLTHYTPNKKVIVKKKYLGYFFKRGKDEDSVKRQLHSQLKNTEIIFSSKPDCKVLSKEYDYVVVATGRPEIPIEFGIWTSLIDGWIKGAIVEGEFDPNELIMWLNRKYCKNGYAYLAPCNEQKAALLLFVPFTTPEQIDYYWRRFLETEKIKFPIIEEFKIQHFCGSINPHKVNNIYFAGASAGGLDPFLGFGQLSCFSMGVFAARSIVEGLDYEVLIKDIVKKEKNLLEIRKSFDKLTNKGYDKLFGIIDNPIIKFLAYKTKINIVKLAGNTFKILNKLSIIWIAFFLTC